MLIISNRPSFQKNIELTFDNITTIGSNNFFTHPLTIDKSSTTFGNELMEIWDILDTEGKKTGKTVQRGTNLQQNEFHLVVHIWIVDLHGNMLIQKRATHLEWMPGAWAVTSAAAFTNETSIDAAVRGTGEELGLYLRADKFLKMSSIKSQNQFTDVYIVAGPREDFLPVVLGDRVADAFWTSWRGMMEMKYRNEFLHYEYLDQLKNVISFSESIHLCPGTAY